MTQAVVGGVQADYTYDGDGVRVSKTVGVDETEYLYDRVGGLPLMVDDGESSYLHVGGTLAQIDNASGDRLDLLLDGLGSVRGIADATGAITGTVDYGAFGGIRGATGAASVFGFTGEQYGPATGLVHLRARQYDPASGRFLSADPVRPASRATIWIPV